MTPRAGLDRLGAEGAVAMRSAGWVVAQRATQAGAGVLFALAVPRLMGPAMFGQYALVTSISMWFALLSGLGAVSMMTRAVPGFVHRHDEAGLRKLVSSLLALRMALGVFSALLYLAVTTTWLGEIEIAALVCIAGAVFSRTAANITFALFLGLNQAARWGVGELLRRWLTLGLVFAGFLADGFRGACAGFLVAHLITLVVGIWLSRRYLEWQALWPDVRFLSPFLRTGAYFAGGNLLLALSQRTGEAMVHAFTGDFEQVGYFGVAYGLYIAGAQLMWHFAVSFAPLLVGWKERGEAAAAARQLRRLTAWLLLAAGAGAIAVLMVGDRAIEIVAGPAYLSAARSLTPMALALVAVSISSLGRLRALVLDRPGVAAGAAGLELLVFWSLGAALAPAYGSFGASIAVLGGAVVNAAFITIRMSGADRSVSGAPASPSS